MISGLYMTINKEMIHMPIRKTHVKGHYIHKNGKRIWVKPHSMKLPSKHKRYSIRTKHKVI